VLEEKDLEQVNEYKAVFRTIAERVEAGIYPPFPRHIRV